MALYQNGILISGANTLPKMTLAEYQALPVSERPTYWERTDLNYSSLPASDVTYDGTTSGLSATDAQGAIDELASKTTPTNVSCVANANVTVEALSCVKSAGMIFLTGYITVNSAIAANTVLFTLGETVSRYSTSLLVDTSNLSVVPMTHGTNSNTVLNLWPLTAGHGYRFDIVL